MNYTDIIRKYCDSHPGWLFDSAYMHREFFSFVPLESYQKILQRFGRTGLLTEYDKGTYIISGGIYQDPGDLILDFYTAHNDGMLVGPAMYQEQHISEVEPGKIELYTRKLPAGKHKTIKDFYLTGVNLSFDRSITSIIRTLELIKVGKNIDGIDFIRYQAIRDQGIYNYSDANFVRILKALSFSRSTVVFFQDSLDKAGKDNHVLEIYEKITHHAPVTPEDYTTRPERVVSEVEFD